MITEHQRLRKEEINKRILQIKKDQEKKIKKLLKINKNFKIEENKQI